MEDRYLFKAKRVDNGEWVQGNILLDIEKNKPFETYRIYPIDYVDICRIVDKTTICQCTGLKDKNSKLIWENDILMSHKNPKDIVKIVYGKFAVIDIETLETIDNVIGWHYEVIKTDALSECKPFCLPMPLTDEYIKTCEFETIGNIFDNKELLESEEK